MTETAKDYSQTLFLPETAFPMRAGLPQMEAASEPASGPPGSTVRATSATRAPSAAKRRAMAAPIPRLAPVTIATR